MFFFYTIFLLILLILIFVKFTTMQIHIQNINFSTDKNEGKYLNKNYKVIIKLYLFNKITFFRLDITKNKTKEKIMKQDFSKIRNRIIKDKNDFSLKIIKDLKKLDLEIKKINLNINIGLEDAASCAISVGILSSIISILFTKIVQPNKENIWKIVPIYQNRNLLTMKVDCIISIKLIHTIYTIYNLERIKK